MSWDWKSVLGKVAPVLATAVGGPFTGTAVKFLAGKFLGREDATEEEIAEAVMNASPEELVKLREIDSQFRVQMRELGIREQELVIRDRESARTLAGKNMLPHILLSVAYSLAYFTTLYIFLTGKVDIGADFKDLGNTLLSILSAAQLQIMNFWFGSSAGSKEKTDRLAAGGRDG